MELRSSLEKRTAFLDDDVVETEALGSRDKEETLSIKFGGVVMIPQSAAMAWAVSAKSPVT